MGYFVLYGFGSFTRNEFHSPPDGKGHDSVMNDVQIGDLIIFLSQYEENGVEELGEFGHVVPPTPSGHSHSFRGSREVNRLALERVIVPPTSC